MLSQEAAVNAPFRTRSGAVFLPPPSFTLLILIKEAYMGFMFYRIRTAALTGLITAQLTGCQPSAEQQAQKRLNVEQAEKKLLLKKAYESGDLLRLSINDTHAINTHMRFTLELSDTLEAAHANALLEATQKCKSKYGTQSPSYVGFYACTVINT